MEMAGLQPFSGNSAHLRDINNNGDLKQMRKYLVITDIDNEATIIASYDTLQEARDFIAEMVGKWVGHDDASGYYVYERAWF